MHYRLEYFVSPCCGVKKEQSNKILTRLFFVKSQKANFIRWKKKIPAVVKRPTDSQEMINDDTTSNITELSVEIECRP